MVPSLWALEPVTAGKTHHYRMSLSVRLSSYRNRFNSDKVAEVSYASKCDQSFCVSVAKTPQPFRVATV